LDGTHDDTPDVPTPSVTVTVTIEGKEVQLLAESASAREAATKDAVRDIRWRSGFNAPTYIRKGIPTESVLFQSRGLEAVVPCAHCARKTGPYAECVVAFLGTPPVVAQGGACASCLWGSHPARCSFRKCPLSCYKAMLTAPIGRATSFRLRPGNHVEVGFASAGPAEASRAVSVASPKRKRTSGSPACTPVRARTGRVLFDLTEDGPSREPISPSGDSSAAAAPVRSSPVRAPVSTPVRAAHTSPVRVSPAVVAPVPVSSAVMAPVPVSSVVVTPAVVAVAGDVLSSPASESEAARIVPGRVVRLDHGYLVPRHPRDGRIIPFLGTFLDRDITPLRLELAIHEIESHVSELHERLDRLYADMYDW
jgi:hypothetical protein